MEQKKNGTIFVLLAAILFSIGGLCIKIVPWNAMAINGTRNLISVILIGIYLRMTHHRLVVNPAVIFGAVCLTATTTLYTLANKMTTAANTIVLQFSAPAFVILLTWLLLRKRPDRRDLAACVVVFGGILIFFLDGMSTGNLAGDALALLSGVSYAGVFMMNSFENSDSLSSIFIGQGLSALIGIWFLFGETDFGPAAIGGIAALGVLQLALAYIFMAKGLDSTPAVTASLTAAIEPILNPIWVAIFWGETVSGLALVGAVIVIGAVVVYNVSKAKHAAEAPEDI